MERLHRPPVSEQQEELILRTCREAESRIAGAPDEATALRIRDSMCERLALECQSAIVVRAARDHVTAMIRKSWPSEGNLAIATGIKKGTAS
jgi:hypothetical protein